MIGTYLKYAFRNITNTKTFSAINIASLVISLAAFTLMALYIEYEFSYDKFYSRSNDIYRVVDDKKANGLWQHTAASAAPVAPALQADFPEIEQAVRIIKAEYLVQYGQKIFQERNVFFADDNWFKVFDIKMVRGNAGTALSEPATIVLTASTASKYFGSEDPIGKLLNIEGKTMTVTGVISNVPPNSHLSYDMLISMATAKQPGSGFAWLFNNWYSNNAYTYVLVPRNYNIATLSDKMDAFAVRHANKKATAKHHYSFEKLTDIYLHSHREDQVGKTGSLSSIYVFSIIAIFILLLACVNFINLSTARALERGREIGIKKVNGVRRGQLVAQFFTESLLMTTIGLVLATMLCILLLPAFNVFSGVNIVFNPFTTVHIASFVIILLLVGLLSGFYPAVVLSGFKPISALKGNLRASSWSINIRKSLVVFQFTISIVLIIGSIVIYNQLKFMINHDLGFKPSQTMVINFEGDETVIQKYQVIEAEILHVPGVKRITASSNVPGDMKSGGWSMDFAKKTGDTVHTEMPIYLTDFDFMTQYNIPVVAGRGFSREYPADTSTSMLINETALRKLGFNNAEEAMGVNVTMYPTNGKIVGIFRDFHFESLQKEIEPLAVRVLPNKFSVFSVELSTNNVQQTVTGISKVWKQIVPQRPLEYTFLNDNFNNQYKSEIKFGQLFAVFTGLAIAIACFGLFGLALFSVKQRTKEVGVRKVMGASTLQVTVLLSLDFIRLVFVAACIASPLAWYLMGKWLTGFAYRVGISWWIFLTAFFISMLISIVTVSYQSFKTAILNPIRSLRNE